MTVPGGVHAVLYALFNEREQLDREAMRQQVELCLEAGVAGIVALGLATEVAKLSFDERQMLMRWVTQDVRGRAPVGFTILGHSVAEQTAMIRTAEQVGADWLILQPPVTGSYAAQEYLDFFSTVIAATNLPTAIQNAPQYLGRGLAADDVAWLRERHTNMTVIKSEGSAVEVAALIERTAGSLTVLNGRGGLEMMDVLDAGASGFILAPDVIDHAVLAMHHFAAGERTAAEAVHRTIGPSTVFVTSSIETLVCYGKRLFAARAGMTVHDRAPALRPTPFGVSCVARHAEALGLLQRRI